MKKYLFSLYIFISVLSYAQETTAFILVRHGEKASDGTNNPPLNEDGVRRANDLLDLFASADISAIYSTDYYRTQQTVAPLAAKKDLAVLSYSWNDPKGMLATMLEKYSGGIVVISGHSNTTPFLANILLGKETFEQFDDTDYGNLLILNVAELGRGQLLHLRF
ncbi:MAG: histidine phosphatase family protein [Cytophagales bacterium]|nr:histidine phosphatase family protein [Cytophagales bacterium]